MTPEAEIGVDQLWKFQLRKEHAELLKDMKTQSDAFAAFAEEAKSAHDHLQAQISTLKMKFNKFTEDNVKRTQEIKTDLRHVQERAAEVEKIRDDLKALLARVDAIEGRSVEVTTLDKVAEALIPLETPSKTPNKVSGTTDARRRLPSHPLPSSPANTATVVNQKAPQNVANTGLRKSRRQAHEPPSPIAAPTPKYLPLPSPPIQQEDLSLPDYVERIDEVSTTTSLADQKPLAAMFISGLASREEQDLVVEELERRGLCKIFHGGKVDIRTEWGQMRVVLVDLGICVSLQEKQKDNEKVEQKRDVGAKRRKK